MFPLDGAHEAANAGPGLAGDDKGFPGGRGGLGLRGDDFDLITIAQLRPQRHQPSIDARGRATIADIRMHSIGEIDRCRSAWHCVQVPFGGEDEHLIGKHLHLCVFQEIFRAGSIVQDFQQFAQPAILFTLRQSQFLIGQPLGSGFLIAPVSSHPQFGNVVHILGANLDLNAAVFRPDNAGMDGAIAVGLGQGDIVLEPAWHH